MKVVKVRDEFINLSKYKKITIETKDRSIFLTLDDDEYFLIFDAESEEDTEELAKGLRRQLNIFFSSKWGFLDFGITINKFLDKIRGSQDDFNFKSYNPLAGKTMLP